MNRADARDCLRAVLAALTGEAPLPLAWAVAYGADAESDPLPAAWAACDAPVLMRALLLALAVPGVGTARAGWNRALWCADCRGLVNCWGCCVAIRAVRRAPTFAEVQARLAARAGAGASS